jgi:hypothetical protein
MTLLECNDFIETYNWDDGFKNIQEFIHENDCTLSQLLTVFYDAGGYDFLMILEEPEDAFPTGHGELLICLYNDIKKKTGEEELGDFESPLTKVQRYKMRKLRPDLPEAFLEG